MTNETLTIGYAKNAPVFRQPGWFGTASHWLEVRRRRMRRNRYLAIIRGTERRYPWLETLMQAMFAR